MANFTPFFAEVDLGCPKPYSLDGFNNQKRLYASVAELVDALDLGSSGATRESSSLSTRTNF